MSEKKCTPVWGSCNLPSGHQGSHSASALTAATPALSDIEHPMQHAYPDAPAPTPRTEDVLTTIWKDPPMVATVYVPPVMIEHARQLELELVAAQAQIADLQRAQASWGSQNLALTEELAALRKPGMVMVPVEQVEAAADALAEYYQEYAPVLWNLRQAMLARYGLEPK